ncbi:sodium:calcium antiporter [Bremerella alba]|uniref:Sodium/calcium exchanger membrane region domain-containing protein n=1 Tax=Bremerella alba TaxID=980252 RepID=A0A7V8V1U6_9BACT|nr:hypothetical protein [Bremerella alba]MBA2113344.1 hypothetical protein [Bremerella alba]
MSQDVDQIQQTEDGGPDWISIGVTIASIILLIVLSPWGLNVPLGFLIVQVVLISIVIWQACDPFADAAQWVGETLRLPGSVRGATLDAVASSMPELFSGIFFVVVAVMNVPTDSVAAMAQTGAEGYGSTLATCAGSAVYNMILIPAFCGIFISIYRKSKPTIDVEPEVISRDGMWFILCELVLIIFLFNDRMYWWMGLVFIGMYIAYVVHLFIDAKRYQHAMDAIHAHLGDVGHDTPTEQIVATLQEENIKATHMLVEKIKSSADEDEEDEADTAGVFYGIFNVRLNGLTATLVLLACTGVAAISCYWLVEVTNETAHVLNVPVFFVAVILAAAASSVPDTFLSIGAAMRGDDSGAVSNVFGSNIFDICICLSIPLLVNSYLIDWQPVLLVQNGKPIEGLVDLRLLLITFSAITLFVLWHRRQLTRAKSYFLCFLYALFIAYAIAGSFGFSIVGMLGL